MAKYSAKPRRLDPSLVYKKQTSWPILSIFALIILSIYLPAGFITGINIYLLTLSLIVWFYSNEKFDKNLIRILLSFGLIIFIGLATGINADQYLYLKDAWYISNPAIIICVGFVLYRCSLDIASGLRAFVLGGTTIALIYLSSFIFKPEIIFESAVKIREAVGVGYYAPSLSFIILIAHYRNFDSGLNLTRFSAFSCLLICMISIIMCFSRTMVIASLIGAMTVRGFFSGREWQRIIIAIIPGLLLIFILNISIDVTSNDVQNTFLGKLARSFEEISIQEYTDYKSINENWRGYETARALNLYFSGSPFELLFGHGFGAQVDLGLAMPLGGGGGEKAELRRFIPILHNGYAYLLVKGGAIAIFLFLYVLLLFYRLGRNTEVSSGNLSVTATARLLQAISLMLMFTSWVVAGVFNKLDMFPFLLAAGFLLGATEKPPGNSE